MKKRYIICRSEALEQLEQAVNNTMEIDNRLVPSGGVCFSMFRLRGMNTAEAVEIFTQVLYRREG